MKFLIASLDGLRPDLIGPDLTPNIARLQGAGITLSSHRTVYPSETRVASADQPDPVMEPAVLEAGIGLFRQTLRSIVVGATVYLDGGTSENGDAASMPKLEAAE